MAKLAKVTDVSHARSVDQLLALSGTDWDVEVLDAVIDTPAGSVRSGGYKAIVRPDTNQALAFVTSRFRCNSHRSQLHTLDHMITNGDIVPATVSVWDNGSVLAYQLRCPALDVVIQGKDVVSPLLTLAFAYGSQLADSAFFADFRWHCKNQMGRVAELNGNSKVKHRGDVHGKFADILANRISELGGELSGRYDAMRRMLSTPLEGKKLSAYFGETIGCSKEEIDQAWVSPADELRGVAGRIPEILDCYLADDAGAPGTVWQAYNAVTRYQTHKAGHNEATRQRRMLLGSGGAVANKAWELGSKLAA